MPDDSSGTYEFPTLPRQWLHPCWLTSPAVNVDGSLSPVPVIGSLSPSNACGLADSPFVDCHRKPCSLNHQS